MTPSATTSPAGSAFFLVNSDLNLLPTSFLASCSFQREVFSEMAEAALRLAVLAYAPKTVRPFAAALPAAPTWALVSSILSFQSFGLLACFREGLATLNI